MTAAGGADRAIPEEAHRARRVRHAFAAAAAFVPSLVVILAVTQATGPDRDLIVIGPILLAVTLGPIALYLLLVRTLAGSVVLGALVFMTTSVPLLVPLLNSDMVLFGLWSPVIGYPLTLVGGLADRVNARAHWSRPPAPPRGDQTPGP